MLQLRLLIVLSILSIIGILTVQVIWVRNAYTLRERQFRQSAFIALQDVADEVARLNRFTVNQFAVTQLSADYFIVNTNAPIDPAPLETFIQQSLQRHNIITDYEYGIYNCETDRMVYGAYVSTSNLAATKVNPTKSLPKFPRYTYYFGIRFPNQTGFVAGQLSGWMWSTAAVLLVVVFFGYTLIIVLKQRRLTEVQRDFINNITHELQTPVSTICIAAEVLQSDTIGQQPNRLKQYARVLGEESRRLQKQINSVLQLARSERTGFELKLTTVNVHELLQIVTTSFGSSVVLDLTAPDPYILADSYHLETILTNLIDNALKYCTTTPHVVLHTHQADNELVCSVHDNGIGIAPVHQKAIFKQFFRVTTGHTHNVKGFGLGLYYVRQVVRAHGWQLNLQSTLGEGSTFALVCPSLPRGQQSRKRNDKLALSRLRSPLITFHH